MTKLEKARVCYESALDEVNRTEALLEIKQFLVDMMDEFEQSPDPHIVTESNRIFWDYLCENCIKLVDPGLHVDRMVSQSVCAVCKNTLMCREYPINNEILERISNF